MNWPIVQLGKIVRMVGGGTPSKQKSEFWSGRIPWVSPKDMNGREIMDTEDHISEAAVAASATQVVPEGSILFVVRSGILVRRFPVAIAKVRVALNQDMKALVRHDPLLPEFLAYFLEASSQLILTHCVKRGATVHSIDIGRLETIPVPVPTKSEQRRIVQILDQADMLRRKRVEGDVKMGEIVAVLFYTMFGDVASNRRHLVKKRLGDVLTVKSGNFLPAKDMDAQGHYPVYGGNGVNGYHSRYMFEAPMIVIGRVGAYCGVVHHAEPKSWVTDNALYVEKHSPEVHPGYLVEALRLAGLNKYAGRAGQPLISAGRIYPVEILVPPFSEQERFVALATEVAALKSQSAKAKEQTHSLFEVMMRRAFDGDLTANWRETHLKELAVEMEQQARLLNLSKEALLC